LVGQFIGEGRFDLALLDGLRADFAFDELLSISEQNALNRRGRIQQAPL
jgi:hypothetical protein